MKKAINIMLFSAFILINGCLAQNHDDCSTICNNMPNSVRSTVLDINCSESFKSEAEIILDFKTDSCTGLNITTELLQKIEVAVINQFDSINKTDGIFYNSNNYHRQYIGYNNCIGDSLVYIVFSYRNNEEERDNEFDNRKMYLRHIYPGPIDDLFGLYWFVMVFDIKTEIIVHFHTSRS